MRAGILALVFLAAAASPAAIAGDEVVNLSGTYTRPNGNVVQVTACGAIFCVTSQTAPFKGRSVGEFKPAGKGQFTGKLTELKSGKVYSGKARLNGGKLTVAGCVLGGLVCKSEDWLPRK